MTPYSKTLKFLYDLQLFGVKVGLKNIKYLLRFLGNPENKFPSIHIAGTNGKGSTAAMIASVLSASGYRTGLYTSPHLISFTERIRINGEKISLNDVVRYTELIKSRVQKIGATFFETTTAAAFKYFADCNVDIAVIETGLGGRLDATNVITPLLSVITNIGFDHTEHLGKTKRRIAYEKGGIIKPSVPCLYGSNNATVLKVLLEIAGKNRAELIRSHKISSCALLRESLSGSIVDIRTEQTHYDNLYLSLAGRHQIENLRLALFVCDYLKSRSSLSKISNLSVNKGISAISKYSGLRGRLDVINNAPLLIADVAHNADGMSALYRSIKNLVTGKVIAVFGVMHDKDYVKMLNTIMPICRSVIAVKPETDRALNPDEIVNALHHKGLRSLYGGTVENGLKLACDIRTNNEPVLITGSHYVVGEAMKYCKISV